MEEECNYHNREAGRMKLKMHSKTSPNSCSRGRAEEKNEEIANGEEEDSALVFKTIMP